MAVFNIPAGFGFLDALASATLARFPPARGEFADLLFLLPTRRAARALAEAFLRASGGQVLLLPRIMAIGAPDEAALMLGAGQQLLPLMPPARRTAILARAILRTGQAGFAHGAADQAWILAEELGDLLDEAALAGVDLAQALPALAAGEFAAHWEDTRAFLEILTRLWPEILRDAGSLDHGAHLASLLRAQAAAWQAQPPAQRIIAAGFGAAVPAVAQLLALIAGLPRGEVVLAGLSPEDLPAGPDAVAAASAPLPRSHPQAGFVPLLAAFGLDADAVPPYPCLPEMAPGRAARQAALRMAMLPAEAMAAWQSAERRGLEAVFMMQPADQSQEARAIALALRGALRTAGARAALVTPDRKLAARVMAELQRFGITADDSAGMALAQAPAAVFLRLITEAMDLHPVPLLALLKHPLAALGMERAALRQATRALELDVLRGPRPPNGLQGMAARGGDGALLARIGQIFAPLQALGGTATPAAWLRALLEAAEFAASRTQEDGTQAPGASLLWRGADGEALALALSEALAELGGLPPMRQQDLGALLCALLARRSCPRGPRGGGGASAIEPRIAVWGLLEARLQSADLIVLGGLGEGVWPAAPESGPWLSNDMRKRIGLAPIEARLGDAALDFCNLIGSAGRVILSSPQRRDSAPSVPSRWVMRLRGFAAGCPGQLPPADEGVWAQALDFPPEAPSPAEPPAPAPPVAMRPRKLSVTQAALLHVDPYAIYARHVLKLQDLRPLDEFADAATFGNVVHDALARITWQAHAGHTTLYPALQQAMADALADAEGRGQVRAALAAWWRPRLGRIAAWIAEEGEMSWRDGQAPAGVLCEQGGALFFDAPAGAFQLTARADRIELRQDGSIAIADYKTGTTPSGRDAQTGRKPQLLLEAAMLQRGGFGAAISGDVTRLAYWRLTGSHPPGEISPLKFSDGTTLQDGIDDAWAGFTALVARYDDPDMPYVATAGSEAARFAPYARLARAAEWASAQPDAAGGP